MKQVTVLHGWFKPGANSRMLPNPTCHMLANAEMVSGITETIQGGFILLNEINISDLP
jgi:hypothetical protein